MSTKLLRHISFIGTGLYLLALIVISIAFREYALQWKWILWGMGEVLFFFVLTTVFYPLLLGNRHRFRILCGR